MDKFFFTKSGLDKFLKKTKEDEDRLKTMYNRLAELAEVGGNQYHDNFSYEQQMRDIDMLDSDLYLRRKILSNSMIIDPPKDSTKVAIGVTVIISRAESDEVWRILGYGESDPENKKIAYNTPFASILIGKQVGDFVNFRGSKISIKKIIIEGADNG